MSGKILDTAGSLVVSPPNARMVTMWEHLGWFESDVVASKTFTPVTLNWTQKKGHTYWVVATLTLTTWSHLEMFTQLRSLTGTLLASQRTGGLRDSISGSLRAIPVMLNHMYTAPSDGAAGVKLQVTTPTGHGTNWYLENTRHTMYVVDLGTGELVSGAGKVLDTAGALVDASVQSPVMLSEVSPGHVSQKNDLTVIRTLAWAGKAHHRYLVLASLPSIAQWRIGQRRKFWMRHVQDSNREMVRVIAEVSRAGRNTVTSTSISMAGRVDAASDSQQTVEVIMEAVTADVDWITNDATHRYTVFDLGATS